LLGNIKFLSFHNKNGVVVAVDRLRVIDQIQLMHSSNLLDIESCFNYETTVLDKPLIGILQLFPCNHSLI
ncbi:hypothetical protein PFISCL1PPCAC_21882, partial [Pristionchus fissidentatus]